MAATWASLRNDRSREDSSAAEDKPCPVAVAACLARNRHQVAFPAAQSLVDSLAANDGHRSHAAAALLPVPFLDFVGSLLAAFTACRAINRIMRPLAPSPGLFGQAATCRDVAWAAYHHVDAEHSLVPSLAATLVTIQTVFVLQADLNPVVEWAAFRRKVDCA